MIKHSVFSLLLASLTCLLSCVNKQMSLDEVCASVPVTNLPYSIGLPDTGLSSHHNLSSHIENVIQNEVTSSPDLDFLFSKETIIHYPFLLFLNEPNQLSGTFFKRLPPKEEYEVFLFSYFDKYYGTDGMSKISHIELQTFDKKGEVRGKMVIYGGVLGWESWIRTFSIDKNYKITLYSHFQEIFDEDGGTEECTFEKQYLINPEGYIVDYYAKPDGIVIEDFAVDLLCTKERWVATGEVRNHLKQGEWIDYEHRNPDPDTFHNGRQIRISYVDGIPNSDPTPITKEEMDVILARKK